MNQIQLDRALQAAGVRPSDYSLPDVPPNVIGGDVTLVLERDGDCWITFFVERGERYDVQRFDGEDKACQHIFELLTRPRGPVRSDPLTPGEAATARKLEEQDRQEYEQWLRSTGQDGGAIRS